MNMDNKVESMDSIKKVGESEEVNDKVDDEAQTFIYVAVLNYFYDCYKRSEGSSEVLSIKKDRIFTYRNALKTEYRQNRDYFEKNSKSYKKLYLSLDNESNFDATFMGAWEEAREEALGDPIYGAMVNTGYRISITTFYETVNGVSVLENDVFPEESGDEEPKDESENEEESENEDESEGV